MNQKLNFKETLSKMPYDRGDYEKQWYHNPMSPPFYVDIFPAHSESNPRAVVFSGIEISLIKNGKGILLLDHKEHHISSGDICFYNCMIPHGFFNNSTSKLSILGIHVRTDALLRMHPLLGDLRLYEPFLNFHGGNTPLIKNDQHIGAHLDKCYELSNSHCKDWDLKIWSELLQIIVAIRSKFSEPSLLSVKNTPHKNSALVLDALHFIEKHYTKSIGLDEIAHVSCCSVSQLSHVFSQTMGISPVDYRNRLRITKAIEQITTKNDSLDKIASEVGFQSFSQFCSLFKKLIGCTPGSLRK